MQKKLAELAYPWPEHDGSPLPAGVYAAEGEGPVLTIGEDRVTLDLTDEVFTFGVARIHPDATFPGCCGMQDGTLHLLMRMLNAPFTLDASCHFEGNTAILTLGGVGQREETTVTLDSSPENGQ